MLKPSKIIAIGLNYYDHARELKMPVPDHPIMFMKPSSAVIKNGGSIIYPRQSRNVHYEGELAIVIGKKAKNGGLLRQILRILFGIADGYSHENHQTPTYSAHHLTANAD